MSENDVITRLVQNPVAASSDPLAERVPDAPAKPQPDPVIEARGLRLAYGRNTVLDDVNLKIHEGDFWCLLGPNGEGKTTLLKAILGAVRPARGKIALRKDFAQRTRLAFVPQESEINGALPTTVREFIAGGLVGLKLKPDEGSSRCEQAMGMLGLKPFRSTNFWTLSGGQRQRCLLARALVRDPLLLIVDEPTAGLDLAAAAGLLEIITELNREKGITVAFVTHHLEIAAERATHAAFFKSGKVVSGPLAEAFNAENLERTFGIPVAIERLPNGRISVAAQVSKTA